MGEITRILAANIREQFFFVITTTASARCLVENFQLICCSQRVNCHVTKWGSSNLDFYPKTAVKKH